MLAVLGYFQGDLDQAQRLADWTKEIGQLKNHSLLIVRDRNVNGDEQVQADFREVFSKVDIIEALQDAWRVWPISANAVFSHAARHIEHFKLGNWFWWENDAIPLSAGWLDKIEAEYKQASKPFLGADVNVPGIERHMSGLGCYPEQMSKHAGMALIAHETAFDVQAARQIIPQAHFTQLIAHSWDRDKDARPGRRTFENYEQVEREVFQPHPQAVLFHASKDGSLIERLRERRVAKQVNATDLKSVEVTLAGSNPAPSICDIFIKTHKPDEGWLKYCLRSIEKFATGFRRIEIIIPDNDCFLREFYDRPLDFQHWHVRKEYGEDGYLSQQVFKMYADAFPEGKEADYFLFMDADTQFVRSVTPETFFKDGKILWMITPYSETKAPWKPITEKFLKMPVEYETMRRHPIVVPRWLLKEVREFCQKTHGMSIEEYVMSQPGHEFSEFNVLGAYAYHFHRDQFSWVDTSKVPENEWPVLTVNQEWSHNPLDEAMKAKLENILGGTVPTSEKTKALCSPDAAVPPESLSSAETPTTSEVVPEQTGNAIGDEKLILQLSKTLAKIIAEKHVNEEWGGTPEEIHDYCLSDQARPVSSVEKPDGSQGFVSHELADHIERERLTPDKLDDIKSELLSPPWKDRKESEREVALLCEALALFAQAPAYKKRVRDALRKVKIIQ